MYEIDLKSRIPLYDQIYRRVVELISQGLLKVDEPLPSIRVMAGEIGINPNTVSKAYANLERDGIIYSTGGRGSFVKADTQQVKADLLKDFIKVVRETMELGFTKDELIDMIKKAITE